MPRYPWFRVYNEILTEVQQCRHKLGEIASWVAFGGVVLFIAVALTMCNALMGLG